MCWEKKKKKNPMIITFLHLWQKHLGLLYSNVVGLAVVLQHVVICLTKTIYTQKSDEQSTYLKIKIHESTRLCQNSVFCSVFCSTWETTCFKVWSWMYLSCTCKDFLLTYIQDFCAKGDKCLWNNWGGWGEGKKKVVRECTRRGGFLGPLSSTLLSLGATKTHYNVSSSWPKTWEFANCG